MKKPSYSIQELKQYILQKKNGFIDPLIEQQIQEDDFLQTVLMGLEKQLVKYNSNDISSILKDKKQKNWLAITSHSPTTNTVHTIQKLRFQEKIYQYLSSWGYNYHYFRIHLLLGFNCSCVLLLIFIAYWLNILQDSPALISNLSEFVGYKQ